MNLYNILVSLSEMSDKKYWPFSWYTFFLDVPVDSIRDSLNKKPVRSLKACELYLFDFDMYTCMYMYLVSLSFYTYVPLATSICCN